MSNNNNKSNADSVGGGKFNLAVPDPPPPLARSASRNDDNMTEIVIVGAGPSGLLTACLLKKSNETKDIKVFDTRQRPESFFGSFPVVLNKRGQTAIEKLGPGLIKKVYDMGRNVDKINILSSSDENPVAQVGTYNILCSSDDTLILLLVILILVVHSSSQTRTVCA